MSDRWISPGSSFTAPREPFGRASAPPPGLRARRTGQVLHAALLATALLVFAWPIALPTGLVAGAAGAAAGAALAERLVRLRYRIGAIIVFAVAILAGGRLAILALSSAEWFALALSPVTAIHTTEVVRWFSAGLGAVLALRATALRYRAALAVEGGVVVLAVATTVAAHREGMIARPLTISDWFWTQGIDPVLAFLAIGVAGALLLAGVLAYGRSIRRTLAQLVFVLMVAILFAMRIHGTDVESPKRGVTGQELESKDEKRNNDPNTGFSHDDLPKPNDGENRQNRPAAIVVFHKDVAPSSGVFYFRHAAFSQFNGSRLIEATIGGVDLDAVHNFPVSRQQVPGTIADAPGRTLVATDVALITEHKRMFALTDAVEVSPLANPEPARFRRAYHVVSSVVVEDYGNLIGSTPGDSDWSDEVWTHYTTLPRDERYHTLAAELRSQLRSEYAGDPIAQALTVKQYLEAAATYSFARNYDGADDPTAAFLFSEDKKGYCVHLAHAAVYLLRSMGVPARVSAGYGVPAQNLGGGSSLLIKSGDAHAWAEIYLEDVGWVPIEVTPEKTDVKPQQFAEKDLQQLLGEMARKEGRQTRDAHQGPKIMDAIRAFLALVPEILLALLALAYAVKVWRLGAPAFSGAKRLPRTSYRAALDRLSAIGLLRGRGEPRERFAKRVAYVAPSFAPLTSTHVGAALGSRDVRRSLDSIEPPPLRQLGAKVAREVRGNVPWWRWVLGVLNPVSWWWSR